MKSDLEISVTKRFEFDAAHRLPNHRGLCRNIHGHRYALEITLSGQVVNKQGVSNEGMIIDFQDLKYFVNQQIIDVWDHALLLHKDDPMLANQTVFQEQRVVPVDFVPTAENLVLAIYKKLFKGLSDIKDLNPISIAKIRLYETPTTWVEISSRVKDGLLRTGSLKVE